MRRQVDVQDLAIGMYVADLDRPWLGSPFLFQGFTIETEEDLAKLRRYCAHVTIDTEAGLSPEQADESSGGGPKSGARQQSAQAPAESEGLESMQRELPRAQAVHRRTGASVGRALEDARLGRSVAAGETRENVRELIDTISANANASVWLTALKRTHEAAAAHSLNVCVLALAFARELGYEGEALQNLGIGALFHDIGKARLDPALLDTPEAELTDAQRRALRAHPMDGYNVLRLSREVPEDALAIVRSHHERLDGKGFPDGLTEAEIPEPARVVAIADRYDALTTGRPGRAPQSPHDALRTMRQEAAETFGTDLVARFVQCIGIYPVGSLVELNTGAVAVVVSSDRNNRLQPVIMMLIDAEGRTYERRPTVSLAARARRGDAEAWSIVRTVDPATVGVDLSGILAGQLSG